MSVEEAQLEPARLVLTNKEVDKLLRGYPPFFWGMVPTIRGPVVRNPIQDHSDIERGGWAGALRMSIFVSAGLTLYAVLPSTKMDALGYSDDKASIRSALVRVKDVLERYFL